MKIIVNRTDLNVLMSKALGCDVTSVVIQTTRTKFLPKLINRMNKELAQSSTISNPDGLVPADKKIAFIKALRTAGHNDGKGTLYGLAEAKAAIENWPAFIAACRKFNRLPVVTGGNWGESIKLS